MGDLYLYLAIGLIAAMYSSVGHGGASGYLAIWTLYGLAPEEMRSSALILNIIVSGIAFTNYYLAELPNLRKLMPFLLGSVPAAFLGALTQASTPLYRMLLGGVLIIAVLRLLLSIRNNQYQVRDIPFLPALLTGIGIGFLSGVIGIGGGILLSPLLIFMRWATIKESACLSAAFILVNSLSGFTGVLIGGLQVTGMMTISIVVAFAGGLLGSSLGSHFFPARVVKYTLVMVLLFASIKLLAF
ncbi:MAG: sulfite exporter TauE/SafE family protein [Bacteroidales bacterium]|nr:sulfite exporter TauE/SafE family protein [Bacteroidales bacterium]